MANDGLVAALVLGGSALAAWALLGRQDGSGGQSAATQTGGGEGGGAFADPSTFSYFDPATGLPLNGGGTGPFGTGGAGLSGGQGGNPGGFNPPGYADPGAGPTVFQPQFSPDFERELLRQNEETNRLFVIEQQKQTRASDIQTAIVAGGTAALVAKPVINTIARTPALLRQAAPAISRVAAPVVRVAGPVGAGVGLGLGGVAVLEKTGALDQVQKFSGNTLGKAPQPVQSAVKTAALPLSTIGAVATGLVGRGNVGANVRSAFQGTYVQKGISGLKGLFGGK